MYISSLFFTTLLLGSGSIVSATPLDSVSRAVGDACKGAAGDGSCKSVPDCKQRCVLYDYYH